MDSAAAQALLDAARTGDESRVRGAVGPLVPALTEAVRAVLFRQASLARSVGADEADVTQYVLERALRQPPSNPGAHAPVPVVLGWVRTVTVNHLLDLKRRRRWVADPPRERHESEGERDATQQLIEQRSGDAEGRTAGTGAVSPARALETRELWQRAVACADEQLGRHKYLREVFHALSSDPDLPAAELAERIGLLAPGADADTTRKAVQYAWQLRSRVLSRLRAYLSDEQDEAPRATPRVSAGGAR